MTKIMKKSFLFLSAAVVLLCFTGTLQASQSKAFSFSLTSAYGSRDVFDFTVKEKGTISVMATWSGGAAELSLILNGPGQTNYYARKNGKSPLKLTYSVTASDLRKGSNWKISVVNFSRRGSAKGTLNLSYPGKSPIRTAVIDRKGTISRTGTVSSAGMVSAGKLRVKPKVYMQGLNIKSKYKLKRNYKQIKELQFIGYQGAKPMTYAKFKQRFPITGRLVTAKIKPELIQKIGLQFLRIYTPALYPNGKVVVAVNSTLYPQISSAVYRYVNDIATQGYYGVIHKVGSTGTPTQLRNYLKGVTDISGVVLVGQLPVAWYEHNQDFCGSGPATCHAEWPCDLFYMDLNGTWGDSDHDGIFDSHTGNTAPEIFLGRLAAYTLPGDEAALVNNYFQKNHRFRTGEAGFAARGITFVDDDWSGWGKCSMDLHLDIVESFTDHNYTTAANYKDKLKRRLAWMMLCCHSWPGGHHFKKDVGDGGYVYSNDIKNTNHPQAFFHNLFCCSSANFTASNYQAGWYTFGDSYGLSTVASAKTGSMLYFEYFYGALAEGLTIGEALVAWWDAIQPIDSGERAWHYGMTIIGDPLLNWRVGQIPHGLKPADGTKLRLPAKVTLSWSPITSFGSVKYKVEANYWDGVAKKWKLQGGTDTLNSSIAVNWQNKKYRWRVKVYLKGKWGPWSPWQYISPMPLMLKPIKKAVKIK